MKKSLLLLLLCAGILTGCGNQALPAEPTETSTVSQTTSAVQAAEQSTTTTTTITEGIPEVTETCSEVISSVTTVTETNTATEEIPNDTESTTTTASVPEEESSEAESITSKLTVTNKVTTTTKADTKPTVTTKVTTTTKAVVTTKVTTTRTPTTTTAKPVTTTKATTTTKTTTTTTVTTPSGPVITDDNLYGYYFDISDKLNDPVLDWTKVTLQVGLFIEQYPIDYRNMYQIGTTFGGTDYEKAVAVCEYAYNLGGQNCIEYALNAYFLGKGAGIDITIARSSKYDWYGHVANTIKLDGKWYYMEPQGNIVGSPYTYAAAGNGISYPNGLDITTDIYEKNVSVTIADDWYK